MIQKNRHTASRKRRFLLGLTTATGIMAALWCGSFVSLADATGTVKVGSAKIREKTDTSSEVVGSTAQGKTVTIKSQVTDAAGVTWYEVYIDSGQTGYIRADLVDKNDDGEIAQGTLENTPPQTDSGQGDAPAADSGAGDAASDSGQEATGATVQAENAMDAQYAVLTVNSNVRSTPSKDSDAVTKLNEGTQVIVRGQSTGSNDGKVWYYVTFTGADGGEKSGFIRSDLLTLGDMLPVAEEAPVVEPEAPIEPEVTVPSDYELVYRDAEGAWYLIDHTTGGEYVDEYKLSQLLEAGQTQSDEAAEDAKTLVKQRIAIVALIVLAVVLIIVVIIMAVKLRDAYYEDYEDDEEEEEEEEEEETPSRRRRRAEEEGEAAPRRRSRAEEEEETPSRRRRRAEEEEETPSRRRRRTEEEEETQPKRRRRVEEEEEAQPKRRRRMEEEEAAKPAANTAAKRRAKNFLLDDDEFEFEFLSMDDKN